MIKTLTNEERAKQFAPFAALKGFEEALRKKEKIVVPKAELSVDKQEIMNLTLQQIEKGDIVTCVYYFDEEYIEFTGVLVKVDIDERYIQIVNNKIPLDDLRDITCERLNKTDFIER